MLPGGVSVKAQTTVGGPRSGRGMINRWTEGTHTASHVAIPASLTAPVKGRVEGAIPAHEHEQHLQAKSAYRPGIEREVGPPPVFDHGELLLEPTAENAPQLHASDPLGGGDVPD